jgi:transcription antitermination factor NusA-like protein
MDREAALQVIRDCFVNVDVEQIAVEYDPLIGSEIAKVVVRDDQLAEALRLDGERARRAAMLSGLDVEVLLAPQ